MNTAEEALWLFVCPSCALRHAGITCADGSESREFATIDRGLEEMAKLAIAGKISTSDAFRLTGEIMASGLEPEDAELDEIFDAMLRDEEEFHKQAREAQRQKWENDVHNRNPRREARGRRTLH
ncbi:hypothetical protein KGQ72_02640 [Patescibacteria group bacterium]|nr:hypothetical protein [Patescibacteria group bacterium]